MLLSSSKRSTLLSFLLYGVEKMDLFFLLGLIIISVLVGDPNVIEALLLCSYFGLGGDALLRSVLLTDPNLDGLVGSIVL